MGLNLFEFQIRIFVVEFVEFGWCGLLSFLSNRSRSSGPQRTLRERVKGTSRATAKMEGNCAMECPGMVLRQCYAATPKC